MTVLARATCERLPLAANSVDLIFTDPPYHAATLGVYSWLASEAARVLRPGGFLLAMCGGLGLNRVYRMLDDSGLSFFWSYKIQLNGRYAGCVWMNRGRSRRQAIVVRQKEILAYCKGDQGLPRTGTIDTFVSGGADKRFHAWGQEVAGARYFIDCFSAPGDLVCDPFIGGGTTMIAAALVGRRCVALDLDPVALATTRARLSGAGIVSTMPLFDLVPA